MKIEPFPWLRDYYVDMNKLYTELILEKIENELLGEKCLILQGYQDMFNSNGRDKILIQADPGMGKTTLGKKVGWDWARGEFKKFSIVFFVFLKLVQPDETIENVILKQNPELEGLGVSVEKLRSILDRFSDRCLLILDGLDEHGLGQNIDVLKIIRNQKLINCGILISSRPHCTRNIEIHFSTVVRVDGFTREQAKTFISHFLKEKKKIRQVMQFEPHLDSGSDPHLDPYSFSGSDSDSDSGIDSDSFIQKCPILLSFFCFLVAEKEIDLSDKTISMGDIYIRLVKCLYKKFTIRKNMEFEEQNFFCILKSVGQLALQTLMSNNSLLRKKEVLRVVGDFAFDYGLFAGHEDLRLFDDLTADVYVSYAHRSLEEFFGSFGFIQALSEGKTCEDILGSDCKEPIFLMNPLFLRFILWFLSTPEFDFSERDKCYDKLTSYVAKRIDSKVFDPFEIGKRYPAIDMLPPASLGLSIFQFFRDTLNKCKLIVVLHVTSYLVVTRASAVSDRILELMNTDLVDRLTEFIIGRGIFILENIDNNSLALSLDVPCDDALETMNLLLQKYSLTQRNPQIYMLIDTVYACDLTTFLSKYTKELYFYDTSGFTCLTASGEFSDCPMLTDLTFEGQHIDKSVPSALKRAIDSGKLPHLRSIKFIGCCERSLRLDWPCEEKILFKGIAGICFRCLIPLPQ